MLLHIFVEFLQHVFDVDVFAKPLLGFVSYSSALQCVVIISHDPTDMHPRQGCCWKLDLECRPYFGSSDFRILGNQSNNKRYVFFLLPYLTFGLSIMSVKCFTFLVAFNPSHQGSLATSEQFCCLHLVLCFQKVAYSYDFQVRAFVSSLVLRIYSRHIKPWRRKRSTMQST